MIRTDRISLGWPLRWAAYGVAGVGYLLGLLLAQRTLLSLLLLTGIYGAWLVVYHTGRRYAPPCWLCALFCLACASLFIPLPSTNVYWLPILPTMTACMMMATQPRFLGLLAAGALWLSTSLALGLLTRQWDVGGQAILLISFGSTCGLTATISELAVAQAQLQTYSVQVEELSVIRERNRIAREIHDTLGHLLTLLAVQLETATQHEMRCDPRLHEELLEARRVAKACLTEVRRSVESLRPDEAFTGTLQEQLQRLVAACETICPGTRISLDLEEATHALHPDLRLTLYRCAQEALTNIRKHAYASKVLLRLSTSDEQVELTALDNGQECKPSHEIRATGFGLQGMRERVALLGGTLRAGPEPQHGWRVEVVLPLAKRAQTEDSAPGARATREKVER
ncbi:MAG TPA: sensor histidine kinase [Ktedonobacteraceae bacterium]|nr:sensor histidine kinase [Ktedonobacteraceae bacterium]